MDALQTLLDEGLGNAISRIEQRVVENPDDSESQLILSQLYCLSGDWERATQRLDVVKDMRSTPFFSIVYRQAIGCERQRSDIFAGKAEPHVFGEPTEWLGKLAVSLRQLCEGDVDAADQLRGEAFSEATAKAGSITVAKSEGTSSDGEDAESHSTLKFAWIADADSRLGPVVEAIIEGRYFWIPMSNIRRLQFERPTSISDMVWARTSFTWANGGESSGLIPCRYPATELCDDGDLQLGRRTEWIEKTGDYYVGVGQRMLTTDVDDFAIMGIRGIDFHGSDS